MSTVHVVPVNDLIEHDSGGGQPCVCGPDNVPVKRDDGSVEWEIVHHSLDGREQAERPHAQWRRGWGVTPNAAGQRTAGEVAPWSAGFRRPRP
ncbi:hypothetical protein M2302_000279 [Micromonospora sp. A200]|nr:hypothetical protein [Micromonospora sp. A200]